MAPRTAGSAADFAAIAPINIITINMLMCTMVMCKMVVMCTVLGALTGATNYWPDVFSVDATTDIDGNASPLCSEEMAELPKASTQHLKDLCTKEAPTLKHTEKKARRSAAEQVRSDESVLRKGGSKQRPGTPPMDMQEKLPAALDKITIGGTSTSACAVGVNSLTDCFKRLSRSPVVRGVIPETCVR